MTYYLKGKKSQRGKHTQLGTAATGIPGLLEGGKKGKGTSHGTRKSTSPILPDFSNPTGRTPASTLLPQQRLKHHLGKFMAALK